MSDFIDLDNNLNFDDLVNLAFNDAVLLHRSDIEIFNNVHTANEAPEKVRERHALIADNLISLFWSGERNDYAIRKAISKMNFSPEELMIIQNKLDRTGFGSRMDRFPTFSRKLNYMGRQFYLGGDYYEEIIILPAKASVRNFIKRFGDINDLKMNIEIADRIGRIWGAEDLTVPIMNVDREKGTITYTHSGKNILETIKNQNEKDAFETVKKGLEAQIELAFLLTKNKKEFRRTFEETVLNRGQSYVFEEQEPLAARVQDILSRIAPGLEKKKRKEIAKHFETGREEKYVIPSDARSVNTVIDEKIRICDLDSLSLDSIHPLLYGYLERIGKVQGREGELVDFAYEMICRKKGKSPSVPGKEKFRARYELQKPFENLRVAEMLVRKSQSDLLAKNADILKKMAVVHYNRALRGMERQEMRTEARLIASNPNVEWLKALDDFKYLTLEKEIAIDEHDYKSLLVRELIDEDYRAERFIPEQKPFPLKVWEKARLPIGIALTGVLLLTLAKVIIPHLPSQTYRTTVDHAISFHVAKLLEKDMGYSEMDYCTLWGDFNRSHEAEIRKIVQRNLEIYVNARHRNANTKKNEWMAIEISEYNQLFGYDYETARKQMTGGYYVDNLTDQWSMNWGLDPEIFRAASHASTMDLALYGQAKNAGYVGKFVLLPMETVNDVVRNRKDDFIYFKAQEDPNYWKDPLREYELASIATQALAANRGNISVIYSKLFAGTETVDNAIAKAGSDDFIDYGPYLPPIARELTERALSYHIPMMLAPIPIRPKKFTDPGDYSYEPIIRQFLSHNLDLDDTIKAIDAQNSKSAKGP